MFAERIGGTVTMGRISLGAAAFTTVILMVDAGTLLPLISFLFSGLGVFAASLVVDHLRHQKERKSLLLEVHAELVDNVESLWARPSPLTSTFPLRKSMLEQIVMHRPRYFGTLRDLNLAVDNAYRSVQALEKSWSEFEDRIARRINDNELDRIHENTTEWISRQLMVFVWSCQTTISEIDRVLGRPPKVVLGKKWSENALQILATPTSDDLAMKYMHKDRRKLHDAMDPVFRAVAEGIRDGTFTLEDLPRMQERTDEYQLRRGVNKG